MEFDMVPSRRDDYRMLAELKKDHEKDLLSRPQVVGLGIGHKQRRGRDTGEPCLSVLVEHKRSASELAAGELIPPRLGRFATDVLATGRFSAATLPHRELRVDEAEPSPDLPFDPETSLTDRRRPAPGGFSVGNKNLGAGGKPYSGTLACVVFDEPPADESKLYPRRAYILSNNHVLAELNDATPGKSSPILQPGPGDGGTTARDTIGHLSRFVPLHFGSDSTNTVDAAIAQGRFEDLDCQVYGIGSIRGTREAAPGMPVQKVGRTSGLTSGRVVAIDGTVRLSYIDGKEANFVDQIFTTRMEELGDSGSLLLDMDAYALGLLIGSAQEEGGDPMTVYNKIQNVEKELEVRLVPAR